MIKKFSQKQGFKFLMGGIFMKSFSFLFNFIFAGLLNFQISVVYACVLVFDIFLGYFVNRHYVYGKTQTKKGRVALIQFILAGVAFRAMDWAFYLGLVDHFNLHIIISQCISTGLILALKFFIYRIIFK